MSGNGEATFQTFGVHDTNLFVSITYESTPPHIYMYVPANNGWVHRETGIDWTQGAVTSFASQGPYIFAGTTESNGSGSGGYRSSNNGISWEANGGSPIASNGTYLFSSGTSTTFRSSDDGNSWQSVACPPVNSYTTHDSCILAGVPGGVYRSTDDGNTWTHITFPSGVSSTMLAFLDTNLFAGGMGVFRSTDSGQSWSAAGLPNLPVQALAVSGSALFAGTDSGVYISLDLGKNWRNVSDGLAMNRTFEDGRNVVTMIVFDTTLFIGINEGMGQGYGAGRSIAEMIDSTKDAVAATPQPGDTLSIYPNPATQIVTIFSGSKPIYGVRVLNVLGEKVLEELNARESNITLDLSKVPAGTYFFQIQTANGVELRKIAVEH